MYNGYITNIIHFFIMLIDFTEFELETIANAIWKIIYNMMMKN